MTTTTPPRPRTGARPVSPQRLAWLSDEVATWQSAGIVDPETASSILEGYAASRRFSLARLLLGLGGAFVGVGLIWLVAANLDQLAPTGRLVAVSTIWLALLATGEALARRGPELLAGALQLVAALGSGAVVFQAAQGLQVPAFEPRLVGLWAVVALVHGYAARAVAPLVVGLATGVTWVLWEGLEDDATFVRTVLLLLLTGLLALALAALHERLLPVFAPPWRIVGTALVLAGLFAAALPDTGEARLGSPWLPAVVGALAVLLGAAAVGLATTAWSRWEVGGAALALGLGALLARWEPGSDPDALTAGDLLHAAVAVVAYLVLAVGVAALGTLRDTGAMTALAAGALVVFTTFQSFAVFARIVEGAWLFLLVGLVFLVTGYLFDRARRSLAAELSDTDPHTNGASS